MYDDGVFETTVVTDDGTKDRCWMDDVVAAVEHALTQARKPGSQLPPASIARLQEHIIDIVLHFCWCESIVYRSKRYTDWTSLRMEIYEIVSRAHECLPSGSGEGMDPIDLGTHLLELLKEEGSSAKTHERLKEGVTRVIASPALEQLTIFLGCSSRSLPLKLQASFSTLCRDVYQAIVDEPASRKPMNEATLCEIAANAMFGVIPAEWLEVCVEINDLSITNGSMPLELTSRFKDTEALFDFLSLRPRMMISLLGMLAEQRCLDIDQNLWALLKADTAATDGRLQNPSAVASIAEIDPLLSRFDWAPFWARILRMLQDFSVMPLEQALKKVDIKRLPKSEKKEEDVKQVPK